MASGDSSSQTQSKRPGNTAFKQQRLKAWQPILTPKPVILSFLIIGIVFIPIGAGIVYSSNQVVEVDQRYDNLDQCQVGNVCNITINIKETMHAPVYMYYRLENFYQNHRRYVKSRNDEQLKGNIVKNKDDLQDCDPEIGFEGNKDSNMLLNPCGLIAKSQFNDTFIFYKEDNTAIALQKEGIAWKSDKEKKFRNPPENAPGVRVVADFEDEDFIVWMRTAGLPDFKKLYRIINEDLTPGQYTVQIYSNFPVTSFKGKKHVVLSTTTWIGGRNPFLGYAYIVVGAICFILGIVFGIKHKVAPRKLGDTKYLEWNK